MLTRKLKRTARKYSMLRPGDKVLVCVSGGPDSVCLLHILYSLKDEFGIEISVCHLDHMLRGAESRRDAEFTKGLAEGKGLPLEICRKNVSLHSRRRNLSIEEAGREIRYEFFKKTARKWGISKIALGHNMDDLSETALMNLMRGAGAEGIASIPPARELENTGVFLIRPLIEASRVEIINFLADSRIDFRQDSSNMGTAHLRNRVRHELIPYIETTFCPRIKKNLSGTAGFMRECADYLYTKTEEAAERVIKIEKGAARVNLAALNVLHPAIRRLLLQKAFSSALGRKTHLYSSHTEQLNKMCGGRGGRRILELPQGIRAVREYAELYFVKTPLQVKPPLSRREIIIPGENPVPELGIRIEFNETPGVKNFRAEKSSAGLDSEKIKHPVFLRARKEGDRFFPLGMSGRKKLKKLMIDKKIPAGERDRLPIAVDADDRIMCVFFPGARKVEIDNRFKITAKTTKALQVRIV